MSQFHVARRVLRCFRRYLHLIVSGSILGLGEAFSSTYFASLQKDFIDKINAGASGDLLRILISGSVIITGGILICGVGRYLKSYASNCVARDFRRNMLTHVQRLPMAKVDSMHSGDLISRTTDDASRATGSLIGGIYGSIDSLVYMIFAFLMLSRIHLGLTILATLAGPVIFLSGRAFDKSLRKRAELIQRNGAELRKVLQEDIQGMSVVRAFGLEDEMERKFYSLRDESKALNLSQTMTRNVMNQVTMLTNTAVMLICAVVIGYAALNGTISTGSVLAFIFLVGRLTWPVVSLSQVWGGIQEGLASAKRVFEILDIDTEPAMAGVNEGADHQTPIPAETARNAPVLRVKEVSFRYEGHDTLFEGLNLTVDKGELVAVVGPSGSGKSTLAKLCLGLYKPVSGVIEVAGCDVESKLDRARVNTSYVPQMPHVFAATLRENIEYGRPGASTDDVHRVISASGLAEFVAGLNDGLETKVGEKGVNLSGGQRQRLALARAILRTPQLVVLDEATSALDNETEASVQKSIDELKRNAGVLVIAHRLTTVTGADRIIVLDDGRIVDEGTHEELIGREGVYSRLWSLTQEGSCDWNSVKNEDLTA